MEYKHCARCWRLFAILDDARPGEIALGLNCGEVYEGNDPDMLIMAFMTHEEAQRYARRRANKDAEDPPRTQSRILSTLRQSG